MSIDNKKWADGIRKVANFFEANPDIEVPWNLKTIWIKIPPKSFPDIARRLGKCTKAVVGGDFGLVKHFGIVEAHFEAPQKDVCTPRIVGKRIVKEKVPIEFREIEKEEDIVEWDCPSVMSADSETTEAP